MDAPTTRAVLGWLGIVLGPLAAAVLVVSALYSPEAIAAGEHVRDLGVSLARCPGCSFCGLSRGFAWMIRGEVTRAVALNPLVLAFWPLTWLVALGGPVLFAFHLLRRSRP
jgi:hypothetical protein